MIARLSHQPIADTLNYLFVKPAAFQLWFSRELPVMFPYTPILCYIARKKWRLALLIAFDSSLVYFGPAYLWTGLIIVINRCDVENYYRSRWSMAVAAFIYAIIVSSSTACMSPRCIYSISRLWRYAARAKRHHNILLPQPAVADNHSGRRRPASETIHPPCLFRPHRRQIVIPS